MDCCVFSKHLQDYDFGELGRALSGIGVDGVDLTVRPGGHVEPEEAADRLPEAVDALKQEGVRVRMITTAITDAAEPHAGDVLEAAAGEGIRFFKLGYYPYDGFGTLRAGLAEVKAKLRDLAAMASELGLWAGFHNHSGPYVGAHLAHVRELLDDLDPDAIGSYFDVGHATVEGAFRGWLLGLDDLADRVRMIAVKDLDVKRGDAKWPTTTRPLGEGLVQWRRLIPVLKQIERNVGPISHHGEYGDLSAAEVCEQVRRDIAFFDRIWEENE
ncbi:MAG: TIM barrel protein [Planctomycetota bacterium]